MRNDSINTVTRSKSKELVLKRVFDAPRELVWEAWTNSKHLKEWWGPSGHKLHVVKLHLIPDGIFHYKMIAPDSEEKWGKFAYYDIFPPERLVFVSSFADEKGNTVRAPFENWPIGIMNTLTLTDLAGKTLLTLEGGPFNASELELKTFEDGREFIQKGFAETFDQLDLFLSKFKNGNGKNNDSKTKFIINKNELKVIMERIFDAPQEKVFAIYTDPFLKPLWWGPDYLTTTVEKMDVTPGGSWRIIQKDQYGNIFGFHGEYKEVKSPSFLSDTFNYEGIPDGHEIFETVNFDDIKGKTKITSTSTFKNIEDLEGMISSGMEDGAKEGWERLAELVEKKL